MSRSIAFRLGATIAAVAVSAAAPGVALGHGFEHVRAAHRHAAAIESARSDRHGHPIAVTVGLTEGGGSDHAHRRIEAAPAGRLGTGTLAALPPAVATGFHSYLSVSRSPVDTGEPERPSTPRGPPPKLRSPPLL